MKRRNFVTGAFGAAATAIAAVTGVKAAIPTEVGKISAERGPREKHEGEKGWAAQHKVEVPIDQLPKTLLSLVVRCGLYQEYAHNGSSGILDSVMDKNAASTYWAMRADALGDEIYELAKFAGLTVKWYGIYPTFIRTA